MEKSKRSPKNGFLVTLSLFASISTLLCCALPALLVALGLGAVVAGVVSNVPGLVWISKHKLYVFIVAGILLVAAGAMRKSGAAKTCSIDPLKAKACGTLKAASVWIYWISVALYCASIFIAYIAPKFFY
jgi:hypothetical protein